MSRLVRGVGIGVGGLLAALVVGLVTLRLVYGSGQPYPDVGGPPVAEAHAVFEADWPLGNVTTSRSGRVFFNFHPFGRPTRFTDAVMFELVDGEAEPYPSAAFQARYQGPFGLTVDDQDRLWIIETGGLDHPSTRLLGFDLTTDTLIVEHRFEPGVARFAQDLRVTRDGRSAVLADTGIFHFVGGSLLAFDLEQRRISRTLAGHPSLDPQNWSITRYDGRPHTVGFGLLTFAVGVDGVALSADGQWLYYAPISHDTLFRLPAPAFFDPAIDDETLLRQIEAVGVKPLSDGIEVAPSGEVLLTDIEHGGLEAIAPTGERRTLTRDPRIVWTDGVAVHPDGSALYTDSAIPRYLDPLLRPPALADLEAGRPYRLMQVRLP